MRERWIPCCLGRSNHTHPHQSTRPGHAERTNPHARPFCADQPNRPSSAAEPLTDARSRPASRTLHFEQPSGRLRRDPVSPRAAALGVSPPCDIPCVRLSLIVATAAIATCAATFVAAAIAAAVSIAAPPLPPSPPRPMPPAPPWTPLPPPGVAPLPPPPDAVSAAALDAAALAALALAALAPRPPAAARWLTIGSCEAHGYMGDGPP